MVKIMSDRRVSQNRVMDRLESIKGNIQDFRKYFEKNYKRFNSFRKFVFETAMSSDDIAVLKELSKPQLEFNILCAHLSRIRGDFAENEPSVVITSRKEMQSELLDFLEKKIHFILFDSNLDNVKYDLFTDVASGGFSVMKIITEYPHPMAMEQEIRMVRPFDPTLCGFDKLATASHKGDGNYSFELYPMLKSDFIAKYGDDAVGDMKFVRVSDPFEGFNWSYDTGTGCEIVMVGDYYEKKKRKVKIVQVAAMGDFPSQVMTEKDYNALIETWGMERVEEPPTIIGKPRTTEIVTIDRYVLCGSKILEYTETDYTYLPHIFIDGDSVILRETDEGNVYQFTRPYLYHAEGIQRLKNYAGVTLANSLENIVQHKFLVAIEAVPEQYAAAYADVQKPDTMFYQHFYENDPDKPLPPPTVAPQAPIPPEIAATFSVADQMAQTILGAYDSALGINDNNLSGTAIRNGAIQSSAAAKPHMVGFLKAWNHAAVCILDLIPKYMKTPASVPMRDNSGERHYIKINQEGGLQISYSAEDLDVSIESGVSFEMQRSQAFQMLVGLMQVSPRFNAFMTQGPGLMNLLENIDIRDIDRLKEEVSEFIEVQDKKEAEAMQMQQQQMQAQMQQIQQSNPMQLKMAELQQKGQKDTIEMQIKQQEVDIKEMLAQSEMQNQKIENLLRMSEIEARNARTDADLEIKGRERDHANAMEILNLHHGNENNRAERDHKERMSKAKEIQVGVKVSE